MPATKDFRPKMLEACQRGPDRRAWAQTVAHVGSFERMGEPLVYPANDGHLVDIPLFFEAGELTGQVTFDRESKVIGLFIRPAPS